MAIFGLMRARQAKNKRLGDRDKIGLLSLSEGQTKSVKDRNCLL